MKEKIQNSTQCVNLICGNGGKGSERALLNRHIVPITGPCESVVVALILNHARIFNM